MHFFRRPFPAPAACAAALIGTMAIPAQAQDSWPSVSLDVFRYDSLINTDEDVGIPCCAPHLIQADGYVLVHISAVFDVPWTEELDRVSAYASKITLTLPGSEPLGPIGSYDRRGLFETSPGGVSAQRPRDWPDTEEDVNLEMEHVWLLPADATTATLTVDEYFTAEIEIPQEASEPISPDDTAEFVITGLTRVDRLDMQHSFNDQSVSGSVTAAAGQILQVDFDMTPKMFNNIGGRPNFLLYTHYIRLVGPNGLPAVPLGQYLVDGLTTDTTNSFSGDIVGATYDQTFYYLTDGAPGTYTLYFFADPVAEATLE